MNRSLIKAEEEAKRLKDEFVSVEHVFLGILLESGTSGIANLFKTYGITYDRFLKTMLSVRGNQRVTSQNPEDTRCEQLNTIRRADLVCTLKN